jgi:hypothetical protein
MSFTTIQFQQQQQQQQQINYSVKFWMRQKRSEDEIRLKHIQPLDQSFPDTQRMWPIKHIQLLNREKSTFPQVIQNGLLIQQFCCFHSIHTQIISFSENLLCLPYYVW